MLAAVGGGLQNGARSVWSHSLAIVHVSSLGRCGRDSEVRSREVGDAAKETGRDTWMYAKEGQRDHGDSKGGMQPPVREPAAAEAGQARRGVSHLPPGGRPC